MLDVRAEALVGVARQNFERAENRAMMAEKFDSETLSLHVLSIP